MDISLLNVVPIPIKDADISKSDIWGKECVTFKAGDTNLVSAPSGIGKTTLLSSMYGVRRDYEGDVLHDTDNIATYNLNKWAVMRQTKLAYIFQGLELFSEISVLDNIQINNGLSNFKTVAEIEDMASRLNVKQLLTRNASTLSFGQQQRIAIIRAMCQPFEFIFLDEPFSHLDNDNIILALTLLKEECEKQNAGLILTSLGNDYGFSFDNKYYL